MTEPQRPRHLEAGLGGAGDGSQPDEELLEGGVLAAQDVAATGASLLEGEDLPAVTSSTCSTFSTVRKPGILPSRKSRTKRPVGVGPGHRPTYFERLYEPER